MSGPYVPPPYPGGPPLPAPTGAARPPWFAALDRIATGLVAVGLVAAYQHFGIATPAGPDADAKVLVAAIEHRLDEIADQIKAGPTAGPDRITRAARAYIAARPASLKAVASAVRLGQVKAEDVGQAIGTANTPASNELAAALLAAPSMPDALDRAAQVMESTLK